ncbi:SusC/RagA family TonB-linked outer membrane protein [Penaeicola halotolerans]|uniref:SusC/RagA family TonB-linked outer membrane protein n=1 Tax=Penaeicola halotolerans TaxID=2793196 RepID=UPI001CF925E3|nr:TonB-dependent receptor [Penaeicola halotolerans]
MSKNLPKKNTANVLWHTKRLSVVMLLFMMMLSSVVAMAQVNVTGQVIGSDGEPIPGVNIREKGTNNGATTDLDGQYRLNVKDGSSILVFTFIGFTTVEETVGNRSTINITLREDLELLEEVVVVGYGTQRKSDLTGSISSVKAEEITRIPTPSVEQALQGRVSGVNVTANSGAPGAGSTVRIRGIGTLNNANPLFVVDGMLLDDINFINPNDVESVEVLKDASATAIYGSRGANGVIIVTTKSGRAGQDNIITFDSYYGVQSLAKKIDLVNANQFATLYNELQQNVGQPPLYDPNQFGEGTDWQDEIFQTAPISSYNIGARGGSDKMTYNLNFNYFSQEGIVKESQFDRFTLRLNNSYKMSENVTFGHNMSLIYTTRQDAPGVISNAYQAYPTISPRNPDGSYSDTSPVGNPLASFEYNSNNENLGYRAVGNAYMDIKLLKNFSFRSSFGLDFSNGQSRNFTPVYFVSPLQQNLNNSLNVSSFRTINVLWENTLTYDKEWGDHRLNVLAGITTQDFYTENIGGSRLNLPSNDPALWYLSAGDAATQTNFNGAGDWSMISYLARANYTFKDKYLLTATLRADGSSRFGRENRYGYFPSIAAGWRLIEEGFLQQSNFLSDLKIRSSYGVIGNDRIGNYPAIPVVSGNQNAIFGVDEDLIFGATIIGLANPQIRWEETEQFDVGLEFGMFDNRLTGEVDYYYRKTNDILIGVPIPAYVGSANNPTVNAASVENSGVDLTLNWRDRKGDLDYSFGVVASTVSNNVLSLGGGNEQLLGGAAGINGFLVGRTVVGQSIGYFYGYQIDGIFQNQQEINDASIPKRGGEVPGDFRYRDVNGDGVINDQDRTKIGSPIPDFIFGFNFSFAYKGFDLSADFNGTLGNEIYNAKKQTRFNTYNFESSYLDRWTGEGTSNTEPRVTNGGHNYLVSERFIEDGSYLRLRNIQLGYTLPISTLEKIKVDKLRVYVSGTNVFTISEYSGYTPEIGGGNVLGNAIDSGIYPIARTFTLGVTANF